MGVPRQYLKSAEGIAANYNYADIAEGRGYSIFYGIMADAGEYHTVTVSNQYSEAIATYKESENIGVNSGGFIKEFDIDFDITFNMPKLVKGKIYANIPIGIAAVGATVYTFNYKAACVAKHWDGTTETVLATGTSAIWTDSIETDGKAFSSNVAVCIADITTLRHFKKGETLRLTVEGWYKMNSEETTRQADIMICHDPVGRSWSPANRSGTLAATNQLANEPTGGGTVTYTPTIMSFHVPFVLDL